MEEYIYFSDELLKVSLEDYFGQVCIFILVFSPVALQLKQHRKQQNNTIVSA